MRYRRLGVVGILGIGEVVEGDVEKERIGMGCLDGTGEYQIIATVARLTRVVSMRFRQGSNKSITTFEFANLLPLVRDYSCRKGSAERN